jgi:uncharacterized membrane protein
MNVEGDRTMGHFLAVTFNGADDAEAALRTIRSLEHAGKVGLEDTAVVRKDADGKVTFHNEVSSGTETGAAVGAVLGGLLFVVFPVGIAVGAVAGGLIGRSAAPGIDDTFVKEVGGDLPAGGSALFLQVKNGDPDLLIGALGQYHGRVRQTSYDDDVEKALDESLR